MSTPVAALDNPFSYEEPEIVTQKPEDKALHCVVFVGDVMTLGQKQSPERRMGGRLFAGSHALDGELVPRCAITPLNEGMMSVQASFIDEKERTKYSESYTRTIRQYNRGTLSWETKTVTVGKSPENSHLLFKRIMPSQEIGMIAHSGVMPVPIARREDIRDAQLFYFPNWLALYNGVERFPERLAELRDMLQDRMAKAQSFEMQSVGRAFLESCDQFRMWGTSYVSKQTDEIKKAEGTNGFQRYDEIAERLFGVLDLTREDKLIASFGKAQGNESANSDKMATAMTMMAEGQNLMMQILARQGDVTIPQAPVPQELAIMPEMQIDDAMPIESSITTEMIEVAAIELDPSKCQAITAGGTQCKNPKEEDGYCRMPIHKPQPEPEGFGSDIEVEDVS